MFKILKAAVMTVCAFMLVFMFLPTGNSASEVLSGYRNTTVLTTSGALPYQYISILNAGDPLLQEIDRTVGDAINHVWVLEDGTPVDGYMKTSTFPRRGGSKTDIEDYTGGTGAYHMGTDLVTSDNSHAATPMYQVALWGGVVVKAASNPKGWGNYVVLDHGNNFYTRYAHMGYGNAGSSDGVAPSWQAGKGTASSIVVSVGDVVSAGDKLGYIGTTGNSSAPHAHIELILCPQGFDDGKNRELQYYYGGVDNVLRGGKTLSEIAWYQIQGDKSTINDMATWGDLSDGEELP